MKFFLVALILVFGCITQGPPAGNLTPNTTVSPPPNQTSNQTGNTTVPPNLSNQTANDSSRNETIRIASFNIQIFGQAKRSNPEIMEVLSKTARNFDIMLVQELRDSTETTLPIYLGQINALPGPDYASVSSPRLGRTSSKENYAYIYNPEKVILLSNYTFVDPPGNSSTDLFQREPFVARFKSVNGSLDFVLVGIHTDPDEAVQEINDLSKVLDDARARYPGEEDFILLGDLNADCSYFDPEDPATIKNSSFIWIIPDSADTTTKSIDCTYDRMIAWSSLGEEYAGAWGIFRFDQEYGLNQSFTEDVSDHYPIWADFRSG